MESPLFRQKSLDRISSPEALHDYMRVTSPKIWMILSAVIVLLAGFLVYASTATMENTMDIKVHLLTMSDGEAEQGKDGADVYTVAFCYLPLSYKDTVETGMAVRIGEDRGKVGWMGTIAEENQLVLQIEFERKYIPMPEGEYDAVLVLESTTPISFLWN